MAQDGFVDISQHEFHDKDGALRKITVSKKFWDSGQSMLIELFVDWHKDLWGRQRQGHNYHRSEYMIQTKNRRCRHLRGRQL